MSVKPKEGVSILDSMIADTVQAVGPQDKRQLTSLPTEGGSHDPLPVTPASFPNDVPTEVVAQKVGELTRIISHLTEARDALQLLIGLDSTSSGTSLNIAAQKQAEAEADRAAAKRAAVDAALADANGEGYSPEKFRALQQEAQDATFSTVGPAQAATVEPVQSSQTCHPDAGTVPDKSPKGRKFNRCAECRTIIK